MKTDVCLVNMPYSSISTPSLALGLLETYITAVGYFVETIYANMEFASKVGIPEYEMINNSFHECLFGEWSFSRVAFPDKQTDDAAFFALFADLSKEESKQLLLVRDQADVFIDEMAKAIIAKGPKIVGCTSTFQQNCASLALLRRIKALNPTVITMMGGANCEGAMGQQMSDSFSWVDYVFSGECDDVIGDFVDKLIRGDAINRHNLPLGFITQNKHLIVTDQTLNKKTHIAAINDMSKVGIPIYDDYFATLDKLALMKYIRPGLVVETSRGCWWGAKQHCSFCGLFGSSMTYRSKPADVIHNELALLSSKYKVTKFEMVDNIIPLDYLNTVIPELAQKQSYSFFYETKSNLKKAHIELFSDAGIKFIQPGIESLNDDFLKLVKKGVTAVQNVALLKWSRTFGVHVLWNLLSDAPMDKENWYSEMAELLPLISHLEPPCSELVKIRYPRFSPYFNNPEEYGITLEPLKSYKYIYPLAPAQIANIAYFFDELTHTEQGIYNVTQSFRFKTPALANLQRLIGDWRESWRNNQAATFSMMDKGDAIILTDTRAIATQFLHILDGNEAKIYRLCAEPIRQQRLLTKISQLDDKIDDLAFNKLMDKLVSNHLVVYLSHCYFALAYNQQTTPYLSMKEYPSGYIDVQQILENRTSSVKEVSKV